MIGDGEIYGRGGDNLEEDTNVDEQDDVKQVQGNDEPQEEEEGQEQNIEDLEGEGNVNEEVTDDGIVDENPPDDTQDEDIEDDME